MGNTNSCIVHLRDVPCVGMGGAREGDDVGAGSSAHEEGRCVSVVGLQFRATRTHADSDLVAAIMGESKRDVETKIETSKVHWSERTEFCADSSVFEDVEVENWEVWKDIYSNEAWVDAFFRNFGYEFGGYGSDGSLEIGEKFAEGGQAELFHAKVVWSDTEFKEKKLEKGVEYMVKVFKKGTPLKHLQSQWPHGMLQFHVERVKNGRVGIQKALPRYFCAVEFGTMLEDGRFAFLMEKEHFDLRTLIDHNMTTSTNKDCGPFAKEEVEEYMFQIALGMSWLHGRGIVHRDLKASNVLLSCHEESHIQCFVADYECSIGVVGTGFFRAPEILKACEDKTVSGRPELFTKQSDVYSYAMTCYEMLLGRLPFDGHLVNEYAKCVISRERPEVSKCVDAWMDNLLRECWQLDPSSRPSFEDVANTIVENSPWIRGLVEDGSYEVDAMDWISWRSLAVHA